MGADSHTMIEQCLDGMDLTGLSIVEVGSRHVDKGTGSTHFFYDFCTKRGVEFWTVDADPDVARGCLTITPNAVCARGEDFLASFPSQKPIVFMYLDNFDWTYPGVEGVLKVKRQAERYLTVHKIERNNTNSRAAHLVQAQAALPLLHTPAFVLFDDTWTTGDGEYDGKGGTAVPFLLGQGFTTVSQGGPENPHVLLRRG